MVSAVDPPLTTHQRLRFRLLLLVAKFVDRYGRQPTDQELFAKFRETTGLYP